MYATGSASLPLAENMHYTILVTFPIENLYYTVALGIGIGVMVTVAVSILVKHIL